MKYAVIAVIVVLVAVIGYFLVVNSTADPVTGQLPEPVLITETVLEEDATVTPEGVPTEQDVTTETPAVDDVANSQAESTVKEFTLDSFNFGYSMDTIEVNQGDTVTINLTSSDGFHDWVVDEFGAATEKINAGENTSVTFVADQVGTFEFYCSVGSHRARGMVGTLVVN